MVNIFDDVNKEIYKNINDIKYFEKPPKFQNVEINIDDIIENFPQPPANTAKWTKIDLIELSQLTRYRTKEQLDIALLVDDKAESIFIPYLQENGLKYPTEVVKSFWNVYYPIVTNIKYHFNRARPWQLAEKYGIYIEHIATEASDTPSYPSGHATYGYILERILSEIYPLHAAAFQELADRVSHSRKILGVHYQSDVHAALKLTNIIYPKIKAYLQEK